MSPARSGRLAGLLWLCLGASLAAVTVLAVRDLRRPPRVRIVATGRPERAAAPGPAGPRPVAKARARPRAPDLPPPGGGGEGRPAGLAAAGPDAPPPPEDVDPADPVAFAERMIDLLRKGDMDSLLARGEPGFIRAVMPHLGHLMIGGKPEDHARVADAIRIDLEEAPGGRFRIRMSVEGEERSGEDLFLVPRDGSWRMAAESDLPGPDADRQRTIERLRLIGLGQQAYRIEGLGGPTFRFADTARDLREGLEGTPAFAGLIDPDLAAAADEGRPLGGYIYGRTPAAGGRFAYLATSAAPGAGSAETLAVDSDGNVWSKEGAGEPAPAEWPADPPQAGWKQVKGGWPQL